MRVSIRLARSVMTLAVAAAAAVAAAPPAGAATTRVSTKTLLGQLGTASEHNTGYARTKFKLWIDADHDGCNTRYEVLIAEAKTKPHVGSGCTLTGGTWFSQYDGVTTTNPRSFDIDHLVPLAEAWASGAYRWNADTRTRYANDLGYAADLIAVSARTNRAKGEDEPQTWLPPRKSYDCTYMAQWVAVKWRWHLKVDPTEKLFLSRHLAVCGWPAVSKPSQPSIGTG